MKWFKRAVPAENPPGDVDPAVRLSELLRPGAIKLNLEAVTKEEALEELVDLLVRTGGIKDRDGALEALHERERLGTTGIGDGIGIPHGKHESIERLMAALGTSSTGIEFDAMDGKPVHFLFLMLARPENPGPHVQALAQMAQLLQVPRFVDRILHARDAHEVLEIIRSEE